MNYLLPPVNDRLFGYLDRLRLPYGRLDKQPADEVVEAAAQQINKNHSVHCPCIIFVT